MFNINKRNYVAYADEVTNADQRRVINLFPGASSLVPDAVADPHNKSDYGQVYGYDSFLEMLAKEFNGVIGDFYLWLVNEENLYIIINEGNSTDYARLFASFLLELKGEFNLTDSQIKHIINTQVAKDYFTGRETGYGIQSAYDLLKNSYDVQHTIYSNKHVSDLSFEMVVYLYTQGLVSKEDANSKLSNIVPSMFKEYAASVVADIVADIAGKPSVVGSYFGTASNDIKSAIELIESNELITNLFFDIDSVDFTDQSTLDEAMKFLYHCANVDQDFPGDQYMTVIELDTFKSVLQTPDIDAMIEDVYHVLSQQFVSSRAGKFNVGLLASVAKNPTAYVFTIEETSGEFAWTLYDGATKIASGKQFPTREEAVDDLTAVRLRSPLR